MSRFRETFQSPFDQYRERIGQPFQFTGVVKTGETHPDELDIEVGPLYRIRFADGVEIDAWPEECLDGLDVYGRSMNPGDRWFLPENDHVPGWVLVPGATTQWIGSIEDGDGFQVADLSSLAVLDFGLTLDFARRIVARHNSKGGRP